MRGGGSVSWGYRLVCHSMTPSSLSPSLSSPQYLGHVEVEESRGMHICEDAVKRLKTVGVPRAPAVLPGTLS